VATLVRRLRRGPRRTDIARHAWALPGMLFVAAMLARLII
jgi:hypothetical protein